MKKKMSFVFIIALVGLLLLSACGGSDEPAAVIETGGESQVLIISDSGSSASDKARLSDNYTNALSVQGQLALGTIQLEGGDQAINETTAAEVLPLWQALQSLNNSQTAAVVEINAVVNQIQDSMTDEQIAVIDSMKLTEDSLASLIEEGEFAFGRGAFGGAGQGMPSVGRPADGGPEGEGGFTGGGLPGGGGRGGGFGGGPGGGGFGNLSEDDVATRRAEFAEGGFGDVQEQMLVGVVVRTLQQKTGEAPERFGVFDTVFKVISQEIGLSVEEIQGQTADGATLGEVVEAHGGDLETVRALLIEAFNDLPNAADLDAEQMAADWLGLTENPE